MTSRQALPGSKWFKHLVLEGSEALQHYLPDTELYSEDSLRDFLHRYPIVFIKPELGAGGRKVFRVLRERRRGHFQIRMQQRGRTMRSLKDVHRWVERVRDGRSFIIQEGINLAYWSGRPVDIRTIVQINEQDRWEVTGMFCKLAGRHLAVTNVCIGGSAHPVERYLKGIGYDRKERERLIARLEDMSLAVVQPFADAYSNAIYGLDIGLDREGNLFLIELNTLPRIGIFREIRREDMFKRARDLYLLNNTPERQEHLSSLPIVGEEEEREQDVADEELDQEEQET